MTTEQDQSGLTIILDPPAVALLLEGLSHLPLGRAQKLYNALQEAAKAHWKAPEEVQT